MLRDLVNRPLVEPDHLALADGQSASRDGGIDWPREISSRTA